MRTSKGTTSSPPGACPACSHEEAEVFYEAASVPTNSCILMDTPGAARSYPKGDIQLAGCGACGFIWNQAFDPALTEYSGRYEETQGFSETFNTFHEALAHSLIQKHDLRGKDILEIGCGKGEFLTLLTKEGLNRGVGFDPGYQPGRTDGETGEGPHFIQEFFSEDHGHFEADFICCKMTLEHIHQPQSLLKAVHRCAVNRRDSLVFFQVPDVGRILKECAFEDIYYEHCSYFDAQSLAGLFRRLGFSVLSVDSVYDGQYLTLEACIRDPERDGTPEGNVGNSPDLSGISSFSAGVRTKVLEWKDRLEGFGRDGRRVVLWGSGSKAVSFLTTLGASHTVHSVVDINPHRHSHFMPGTGHPIVAPEALPQISPHVVIILNRVYTREITESLLGMGLSPEVIAL